MSEVLERIEASYRNLVEAIEGVPEDRLSEPRAIGEWSVKDVLAHTAYWNERSLTRIERKLRGEAVEDGGDSWQVVNERVQAERAGWPLDRITGSLKQVHDRFVAIVAEHPEVSPGDIEADVYEHVNEHAAEIRAWREQPSLSTVQVSGPRV